MIFVDYPRLMLLLMTVMVVSAEVNSVVAHPSAVLFDDDRCTSVASMSWLPSDELRHSWGSRPKGYGKWGYTANVPPYIPPYQTTGHPADVFDGDQDTGFVWKTASIASENCPADSGNCQILTINGDDIAAYNQKDGGRRCYGCQGVSACTDVEMSAHPLCSTAMCEYCENLSAYMIFDTQNPALIQTIAVTVQNERRSPRTIVVYYARDSIVGPFYEFATYNMSTLVPGEVTLEASNHQPVVSRYWKIEITSNWGDPENVELLELKFYGQVLSQSVAAKWVDSASSCSSPALSASVLNFGFATVSDSQRQLENGEFKLEVDDVQLGPYTITVEASKLRDDLYDAGFSATVTKYVLVEGTKTGKAFRVSFFTPVTEVNVLIRNAQSMITGLMQFPTDLYTLNQFTKADEPEAYCYNTGKAVILSTFASVPESHQASLCLGESKSEQKETVYGLTTVVPSHGPIGGVVMLNATGNIAENVRLVVVDSSVSASEDCLGATSILTEPFFVFDNGTVRIPIDAPEAVPGARFCMQYDNGIAAIVPAVFFDVEEPMITSIVTPNCGYAAIGMESVSIVGSGLGVGDEVFFANGNCEEMGMIAGTGVVSAAADGEYTLDTTFTSVGIYHVIARFSGLCRAFPEVTVTIFEMTPTSSHLYENYQQTLTITGTRFTSNDAISFTKNGEQLSIQSSVETVTSNGDRIVFSFLVQSPAEEGEYHLLYHMASCETPFDLNHVFTFHTVSEMTTTVGESTIVFNTAIINTLTSVTLKGLGFSAMDSAYFKNENGDRAVVNFNETSSVERTGTVTFTAIGDYHLVYSFEGNEVVFSFTVSVSSIAYVEASSEAREVSGEVPLAVKNMLTLVEYHGHGIHDTERENAYYKLTPNSDLTGGNSNEDAVYCSGRAVASHGPYVTVDEYDHPMDTVFAFENGGRSSGLNHWIIYDLKNITTLHQFGMYVNSVFFPQLPRDFEVQRLVSCYEDSCLFDTDSAKMEAPWQTVLSVKNMPRDNSQDGKFLYWDLDHDSTARYFRLLITKNWGSTVFTSVIQIDFIGAKADYENMNRARWVDTGAECENTQFWSVSSRGHSTLDVFTTSGMKDLCFDFTSPRGDVDPMKVENIHLRVAEATSLSPISVAAHVNIPMEIDAVYGATGDRIKFALPGSTQDSDCWGATSQSFGSIEDKQTVIFQFDKVTHKGSFILKSNGVNTVPIYVDDTELEAAIKMEQLPTIDKASVSIQRSGQYTVKFTITVLEPAGAQPDLEVVLPGDSCRKCTSITNCDNERFIYDSVNGILQIVDSDSACSFSEFELNREYVFSTATSSFAFIPTSYIFDGNENAKSIVATAVDHTTYDFVAASIQTCPESDKCEAFAANVLSATVEHETVGNGAVGEMNLSADNKMTTNIVFTYNPAYINLGAPLCYKFGSAPWKIYPALKIDLYSVIDVTPREIIAGQPTTVVVTGTPGSIKVGDYLRVLKSGDDCYNGDFAPFIRNGVTVNTLLIQKDGEVEMTFASDLEPSSSWTLCYKFADSNVFVHYTNIKFTVMSLKSMEATVPSMANNLIVANQSKWFTITGNSLTLYDVLFFVPYGQACDATLAGNNAISTSDKILESTTTLKVRLTFPEPTSYSSVLCYHFANDLDTTKYYKFNDFTMNVVDITAVTPTEGYAREPEANFVFSGFWPMDYALSDSVEWILESDATVRVPGVVSRVNLQSSCDVKFDTNGRYYLSYRFGQELAKTYPEITIYSLDVLSIRNQHAVVGCLYKPEMEIDYFRFMEDSEEFDSVSFKVVDGSCVKSEDALPIDGKREGLVNRAPVSGVSSTLATSEFLVKDSQGGEYSMCYHWSNAKTVDYPNLKTFFHKFSGFTTSTVGSAEVLVEGVEEELMLSGSGIEEGDQIRLITPRNADSPMCSYQANRGDDECMAPFEDKTFTVTADRKVSMQVDSVPSGSLQVCYRFKDLDYFVKMPVFITVAGLTSIHVNEGSANVMVVGSPKTYSFNGLGVNEGDKVYWGSVCDGSVEDQKHQEVTLGEDLSATFIFNESQKSAVLCYKHGNEPYHMYSTFSLTVKELKAMEMVPDADSSNLAIVDQPKTVKFTGEGISSEYNDVARWVRGDSCESEVVPLMSSMTVETDMLSYTVNEEEAEQYKLITSRADRLKNALKTADVNAHSVSVDADGFASFSFAMDSSEQSDQYFYLCYKFGEEPFHLYKDITMRVFDLYDARSYSTSDKVDDKYVIAAGSMVPVEFTGYGVSVGDRAYWVRGDHPCRPKNALPISSDHLYSDNVVSVDYFLQTSVMFTQGYEELVSLCYQFGNEEPKRYDFPYRIARVNAIRNVDGTQSFVTYVDSEARFYGFNLNTGSKPDHFALTSGEDCSSDLVSMVDLTTNETVTFASVDGDGKARIRFMRGGTFSLCMIFGDEALVHYPDVTVTSHSVEEIIPWWTREEVEMGYSMSRIAIKGMMKKWNVQGSFNEGDLLRFAMNGDCSGTLARLQVPSSTQYVRELPILYDAERARYYFDVAFIDGSEVFKTPFTVCYRSRSDLLFYPTLMKIEVMTIEMIEADVGSSTAAVIGNSKNLMFSSELNYGVQLNDKVGFSKTEDCSAFEGETLVVDESLNVPVLFAEGAESFYHVCYQFQGQPWYRVSEMHVYDVLGMNADCTDCSNDISVMYIEKSYTFVVNGDHKEGVDEYAKWVYGDEGCDGKSALLSQVSVSESRDYSGDLVEIEKSRSELAETVSDLMDKSVESIGALHVTGNSTAMTFLQSSYYGVDNKFSLCYKFGEEPFKLYPNIRMTVVGIDSISSNKGLYSTLVAGVPETWTITGFGFSDQDMLKLVRGTECTSEAVVETGVYGSSAMEAYVKDLMVPTAVEGALTVCWKFENEEYAFMTKYAISVYDITSASPAFAVEGVPTVFSYTGTEVKEGDFVRYTSGDDCDSEYATFNGIPDKKVDAEHSVELSFDHANMKDYKLCYKFDEEPYKQYNIPVEVATVTGLYYRDQNYQSISLSLSVDYSLSVVGINLHAGDRVQFVPESYTSCDMVEENDPPLFATPVVTEEDVDKERVLFTARGAMCGIYKLCYAYKSEPTVFHPYFDVTLVFQGVLSITADQGDNYFMVVDHSKSFTVTTTYGTGSGDMIALTAGLTCDEENLVALNAAGDKNVTVDDMGRFSMTLQESSASAAITNHNASCFAVCYSYMNSPDTVLMKRFCYTVASLDALTTQTIQGQTNTVQVSGYMMREGDSYGWTEGSVTSCEETERLPFYHSDEGEKSHSTAKNVEFYPVPSTGYIEEDGTELFNLFSSFKDANSFAKVDTVDLEANEVTIHTALDGVKGVPSTARICYKFANEPVYPFDVVLNLVAAVDVQPQILVNHKVASLEVSLNTAVEGAKVKFVGAGEQCDSTNVLTVGGESELAAGTAVSGEISVVGEAASEYMVCLRLAEGEYHAYPEMTVRVVDFQLESVDFVVADFSTSLTVTAASGLTLQDECYFTTLSVCDGSNIVEIDGTTFTPMAGSISVTFMDSAKNVNLCYVTEGMEPVLVQTNVIGEVAQLLHVEGLNMHYSMLPDRVEKQLRLYGSGLITGEFWLSKIGSNCNDVSSRLPLVNNDQNAVTVAEHQPNEFTLQPLSQVEEYHLCYSYRTSEVKRYSEYLFYSIAVTSIVAREVGDDALAVVGAEKLFNIAGSHLTVDDYLGWSRTENCTDMVPIQEGDGFYTPLLADATDTLYFKVTFKDNSESVADHQFYYCFNSHLSGSLPVPFRMTVYELTKTQWSQGTTDYNEESATFLNETGEHMSAKGFDLEKGKAHYEVKFTPEGSDEVLEVVGATSGTGDRLSAFTTLPEMDNENVIANTEKIEGLRSRLQSAQDIGTVVSVDEDSLIDGFGSATKEVRFVEGLSSDVVIEPHFKFGYEDFARSEKGAFKLYHIDDLRGVEGSAHDVVVGVSKVFQFVGYEVTAGDKFWFVQPEMSCDNTAAYAMITYKDVTDRQFVTVAAEDTTFELTFLDAVPELSLCYQFHNRADHVLVPGVTLKMHTINSITPTVATYNKWTTVNFSDSIGVSSGDLVRWVPSGQTDCTQNIVASDVMEDSMDHAFFFSRIDDSITTVALCYQFGEESWAMYPTLTIQLREILSITPQDAVRNLPRTITVEGSTMESTDRFAFVSVTEHCSDLELTAGVQATALSSRVVSFSWTFTSEEIWYKFCYMTGSAWTEYSDQGFLMEVYSVNAMPAATVGSDTVLVKSAAKSFTVEGSGVDRVGNRAFFVPSTAADCSDMNYDIMVVSEGSSTYRLTTEKTTGSYALCYQFFGFPAVKYSTIVKNVISFTEITTTVGDVNVAVKDMTKPYGVLVDSVPLGGADIVWFSMEGTACAEPVQLVSADNVEMTEVDFTDAPTTVSRTFGFKTSGSVELCYKFYMEPVLPTGVLISVKEVTAAAPGYVYDNVPSAVTYSGVGIADGDVARWIPHGETCTYTSASVGTVSDFMSTHTITPVTAEDEFYELCYEFKDSAQTKHYTAITMIVKPTEVEDVTIGCKKYVEWGVTVDTTLAPQNVNLEYTRQDGSVLSFTMNKSYTQTEMVQNMPSFGAVRVTYMSSSATEGTYLFVFLDDECSDASMESSCTLVLSEFAAGVTVERKRLINECQAATNVPKTLLVSGSVGVNDRMAFVDSEEMCTKEGLMEDSTLVSNCVLSSNQCNALMTFTENTHKDFTFSLSCTANEAYSTTEGLLVAMRLDKQFSALSRSKSCHEGSVVGNHC